ncbi:gene transfer agent family protein [Pacificoceanicola onchidii]|uniref:gene transfer agent family protein n=1 Tax=Pacificoceanicola onchidii TaxID=2562685 RepID=UPI0010A462F0|nr:gene transfer agent family protein [Pacificoceanicola onchidii]
MTHRVSKIWAGGEHDFALGLAELRALQKNCDAGPEVIMTRLRVGSWMVDDVIEVLRLGLIGAEMEPKEAGPLVTRTFEQYGAYALKLVAYEVITAALIVEADDPVGEPDGVEPMANRENGNSPESTVPGP